MKKFILFLHILFCSLYGRLFILMPILVVYFFCFSLKAQTKEFLPKITNIKAKLFYNNDATFSADVLENPSEPPLVASELWNTPFKNVSSVLVLVEIMGEIRPYGTKLKVHINANYKTLNGLDKKVISKVITVNNISGDPSKKEGRYFVPVWLYDVGCYPVKITSSLTYEKRFSKMTKTIYFGCGE